MSPFLGARSRLVNALPVVVVVVDVAAEEALDLVDVEDLVAVEVDVVAIKFLLQLLLFCSHRCPEPLFRDVSTINSYSGLALHSIVQYNCL
jgi:hypothetical protein